MTKSHAHRFSQPFFFFSAAQKFSTSDEDPKSARLTISHAGPSGSTFECTRSWFNETKINPKSNLPHRSATSRTLYRSFLNQMKSNQNELLNPSRLYSQHRESSALPRPPLLTGERSDVIVCAISRSHLFPRVSSILASLQNHELADPGCYYTEVITAGSESSNRPGSLVKSNRKPEAGVLAVSFAFFVFFFFIVVLDVFHPMVRLILGWGFL